MKTASLPSYLSPSIAILALLAAAVIFIGVTGAQVPWLSSVRVDIVLLVGLGMAICALGGIGRISAARAWSHPLSIVGYLLGCLILLITLAVFAGWRLPFLETDRQALIAIAILAALKVLVAAGHYSLGGA